jgi:cytidylate kinase
MYSQNAFHSANAFIISQLSHTAKQPQQAFKQINLFVTISRESGAGGSTVAEKLIHFLNENDFNEQCKWTLFDKNIIEKVIEEHNLPENFKNYFSEKKISEIQSAFEQLMGLHASNTKLTTKICSTIINLASMGNVVIVGRGANILTRNLPGGFHVRLIAEYEWRVKHVEMLYNYDRSQAVRYIENIDSGRNEYVKKLFSKNIHDPLLYDLVIKTNSMTIDETAEIIGRSVLNKKNILKLDKAY